MIKGKWKDPNLRFEASDDKGKIYKRIVYSESKHYLEQQLEDMGLIDINIQDYDFKKWKDRAAKLARRIEDAESRAEWVKILDNNPIWKELKWHLFFLFHGKCAYCESKVLAVAPGDVEHYRPKKKVEDDSKHEGYYWLAYETSNLVPACENCNRTAGKLNQFPVRNGTRAYHPKDIEKEEPLLLMPIEDEPQIHLTFITSNHGDKTTGKAKSTPDSDIGAESLETFDLNRGPLLLKRRIAMKSVENDLNSKIMLEGGGLRGAPKVIEKMREELIEGASEYSAAILIELDHITHEYSEEIDNIRNNP